MVPLAFILMKRLWLELQRNENRAFHDSLIRTDSKFDTDAPDIPGIQITFSLLLKHSRKGTVGSPASAWLLLVNMLQVL